MLRAEHTQGVNRVVLTPHFYCEEESIEVFLQRRKKAFSALQTAISDQPHTDDIPELCLGAEVAMSSALAQMDLQPLCISGTNVLLLELPYYRRFRLKDVETIDADGNAIVLKAKGRHDPCVLPRAVPIVEAMAAMTILDNYLINKTVKL